VRRVWTEILAAAKRQRRTTQVLLESATVAGVDGATLLLTMPSAALARRVLETGNSEVLRDALREVLGVDWRIRCDAAGSAGSGSSGGAAPDSGPAGGRPVPGTSTAATGATGRAAGRGSGDAGATAENVPPEPPEHDEPDPYDDIDPAGPVTSVQDPEQAAMELLAARLGARRLEQQG
jgi:DNA polymerase-3 subunit gamma/tau